MELRHLRYLVAVAEEGTFVRAATRLRLAQPALSRQIRDLEREIGMALLERGPRAIRLTPAGEATLAAAGRILDEVAAALDRARRSSRGLAGRCVVGIGKVGMWGGLTPRLLDRVGRDYPLVEVEIVESTPPPLWDEIRAGRVDIGVGVAPLSGYDDLATEVVFEEVFDSAALSSEHRLAQRERLRLADLEGETYLTLNTALTDFATRFLKTFADAGHVPARLREVDNVATGFSLVAAGKAWTMLPSSARVWIPSGTVLRPLEHIRVPQPFYMLSRASERRAVVHTVQRVIRELGHEAMGAKDAGAGEVTGAGDNAMPDEVPTGLELRHLRYFAAVVNSGSLGRAAERLGVTQPALSRQMRDLERAVGARLLVRDARGVTLTPAGESLSEDADRILADAERIPAEAQRVTRDVARRCVVATIPTPLVQHLVSGAIRYCAAELADVEVVVVEVPTPRQPESLRSAHIDIGICHSFSTLSAFDVDVQRHRLVEDAVNCAVLGRDHPLARRTGVRLADLANEPFLFMSRALYPAFHDQVMESFAAHDFRPIIEASYDGLQTTWSLARAGRGWCIGFRSYLRYPPAGLVAIPIEDFELPWGVDALHRRDETRSATLAVLEAIRQAADEESGMSSSNGAPAPGGRKRLKLSQRR